MMCTTFPNCLVAVSYTHLDVYKRQVTQIVQQTEERCENLETKVADISQNTEKEFANYLKELKKAAEKGLNDLSLIHI